uniref:Uncharacterized protein n=1 Tax=Arion vulgaris TaxID=1028688 RepID=A0A0B7BU86_9EUPU
MLFKGMVVAICDSTVWDVNDDDSARAVVNGGAVAVADGRITIWKLPELVCGCRYEFPLIRPITGSGKFRMTDVVLKCG